jgi:polyphosphate kinase
MSAEPNISKKTGQAFDLDDPGIFINREISWLKFNWRVLEEAMDETHPLLERVKFLAIFASNLDEFFMVRVSGLRRQVAAGIQEAANDNLNPAEQLMDIRKLLSSHLPKQVECWKQDLLPKLGHAGIHVLDYVQLQKKQKELMRKYFEQEIFPILTPLAFDPGHPFPHISNLSLNLAVVVKDPKQGERFARLKIPDSLPRLVPIPDEEQADEMIYSSLIKTKTNSFVWLEQVIAANLDQLFPGLKVGAAFTFRITRDADLEIEEDEASDLLSRIEEGVENRDFGQTVRLEVDAATPERIREILMRNLKIEPYLVYSRENPIGMRDLWELVKIDRPDLKDPVFLPTVPRAISKGRSMFDCIRERDILLYHPYDSFMPVLDFIREAANDQNVLAIKQTLYRIGPNPPIVEILKDARRNGKQVAVLVELKARFDEENNIAWARALEDEGVHVVYGLIGLKTHAKMTLVVRKEPSGIVRYVHLSTGNYNTITSRIYADIGYFTADKDITTDISDLFNALTGYSRKEKYRKILVAPKLLRTEFISRIEREEKHHLEKGNGYLAFKMNALVDKQCIRALYRASQAGVKIDLNVRGICCLRPGVPGMSENIRVTSIVGRFLEHARIYYFRNGGEEEVLLGSADLMPRNLDRRVEILFPVQDSRIKKMVVENILLQHLNDNVKGRELMPDGNYERVKAPKGGEPLNSQQWLIERRGSLE